MARLSRWQVVSLPLLLAPCVWGWTLGGEVGATIIDDDPFWAARFRSELAAGRLGVGLDAELLWQRDGFREEDWAHSHKWVRFIRYVRWGAEDENVFALLGALDDVTIGHGFVVRHFTNWYDEDLRRLGLHFSGRTSRFGGQAFSSSVGRWEVAGARLRAELFTGLSRPLQPCRIGLTMVTDFDPDPRTATEDGIAVLAADADFPLARDSAVSVSAAVDLATIMQHGWGGAMGLSGDFGRLAGVSGLKCRLERRFIGPDFMTEYVDAFYGVDRFVTAGDSGKADALGGESGGGGWYGEVQGVLLDVVAFAAGFSRVQGRSRTGVLHVNMSPRPIRERWEVRLSLNKALIEQLRDITRRDRTLLETTAGYRIRPWAWLYVRFRQTFEKQEAGYCPVSVVVPRLSMSVTF